MGIFKSKDQKEVEIAIGYLNQFLIDQYDNWTKKLRMMIGAKAASEHPLEKVEPIARLVWIETFKYSMQLMIESEKIYELVTIKTPMISSVLSHDEFMKASSNQSKRIGASVGLIMKEICQIHPDWEASFNKHLEEPLVSELKTKAKESISEYLKDNSKYHS
jgi:hypothetical protein